jgi:hypothetical protein
MNGNRLGHLRTSVTQTTGYSLANTEQLTLYPLEGGSSKLQAICRDVVIGDLISPGA